MGSQEKIADYPRLVSSLCARTIEGKLSWNKVGLSEYFTSVEGETGFSLERVYGTDVLLRIKDAHGQDLSTLSTLSERLDAGTKDRLYELYHLVTEIDKGLPERVTKAISALDKL